MKKMGLDNRDATTAPADRDRDTAAGTATADRDRDVTAARDGDRDATRADRDGDTTATDRVRDATTADRDATATDRDAVTTQRAEGDELSKASRRPQTEPTTGEEPAPGTNTDDSWNSEDGFAASTPAVDNHKTPEDRTETHKTKENEDGNHDDVSTRPEDGKLADGEGTRGEDVSEESSRRERGNGRHREEPGARKAQRAKEQEEDDRYYARWRHENENPGATTSGEAADGATKKKKKRTKGKGDPREEKESEREKKKWDFKKRKGHADGLKDHEFEWSDEFKARQKKSVFSRLAGGKK